jgi:hypothetical protein
VDSCGNADGGVPNHVGRQDLRDWVDQIVRQVEPAPDYAIKLVDDPQGRGTVAANSSVVVVGVFESSTVPHMAPDSRYYIRAGAHTVPARSFIVESIWAKRHFAKPRLAHVFREKPSHVETVQLGIVPLTSAPAIEVEISLDPLGELLRELEKYFPLKVPVIDHANPFFFDVSTWHMMEQRFGADVRLQVRYKDLVGNDYLYDCVLDVERSFGPMRLGTDAIEKIARSMESIDKTLKSKHK